MALFDVGSVKSNKASRPAKSGAVESSPGELSFWKATQGKIEKVLGDIPLKQGTHIHFYSNGEWSMHDLLAYFLSKTGPSRVYLTTWAISEMAMRQLYTFMKEQMITELYAIIDFRNTSRKPAELQFIAQNATKINLAKCHAKVTVIDHPDLSISINTSANYTRNPRLEAGVITVDKKVSGFHKEWIIKELNHERGNTKAD